MKNFYKGLNILSKHYSLIEVYSIKSTCFNIVLSDCNLKFTQEELNNLVNYNWKLYFHDVDFDVINTSSKKEQTTNMYFSYLDQLDYNFVNGYNHLLNYGEIDFGIHKKLTIYTNNLNEICITIKNKINNKFIEMLLEAHKWNNIDETTYSFYIDDKNYE